MGPWLKVKWTFADVKWSEGEKRELLIKERNLDFPDIKETLENGEGVERMDDRKNYKEDRWQGMAELELRVLFFAFTVKFPATVRVFSLRKANDREVKAFKEAMRDEDN